MFKEIRRKDRVLEDNRRIDEILQQSEYGFLSLGTLDLNGYAYGLPMSYAYDEESRSLYFHCAPEGQKLDAMRNNNKVSFCVVGKSQPMPKNFTTLYESVVIFGKASLDLPEEEKRKALRLIVLKYAPDYQESGEKYMGISWNKTYCFKIEIEYITAKAKTQKQIRNYED